MKRTHKTLLTLLIIGLMGMSQSVVAGGYRHHGGHHHGHHGHGGALAAGLLIGGLFGYLINEDRHRYRSYSYRDYDYRPGYYPRSTVVYERVERVPAVVTNDIDAEFAGQDCLMTREYTTTVTIDGVDKEAYGTRCMLSDGTWVLGKPKFMPEL